MGSTAQLLRLLLAERVPLGPCSHHVGLDRPALPLSRSDV
jgi:hypothetical protein